MNEQRKNEIKGKNRKKTLTKIKTQKKKTRTTIRKYTKKTNVYIMALNELVEML